MREFVPKPSREKAILENPQIFQNCEIKIIFPLNVARAKRKPFQTVFDIRRNGMKFLKRL